MANPLSSTSWPVTKYEYASPGVTRNSFSAALVGLKSTGPWSYPYIRSTRILAALL